MTRCPDANALAELLERVRSGQAPAGELVENLREDSPIYAGRSTAASGRIRGSLLAAFAEVGLPESAVPFVREELRTGAEPYQVAAAARAVRGGRDDFDVAAELLDAFRVMRTRDEPVSFAPSGWSAATTTSALREIVAAAAYVRRKIPDRWRAVLAEPVTLDPDVRAIAAGLAAETASPCCGDRAGTSHALPEVRDDTSLVALRASAVEDHAGVRHRLGDLTLGRPTVLTFFYTRCDNPRRCSLTIARLAALDRWLDERGARGTVRLLALTYDPEFDLPARMRRFAADRGLRLHDAAMMGRLTEDQARLREHLQLRVGRGGSTVNRHAAELFIFDPGAVLAAAYTGSDWDVAEVGATATGLALRSPWEECAPASSRR